jgi:hypothetical protein
MHPFLSPHAQARMQQRAISAAALERLLDFGTVRQLDRDKEIVFFDKKAKQRLARSDKALARCSHEEQPMACQTYRKRYTP